MYCSNCGTQLTDDANFCLKCGKPVAGTIPKTAEEKWETCEIVFAKNSNMSKLDVLQTYLPGLIFGSPIGSERDKKYFVKTIGPTGVNIIAETRERYSNDNSHQQATEEIDTMVTQLIKDGWESTGRGEKWFNYKFRRKIT